MDVIHPAGDRWPSPESEEFCAWVSAHYELGHYALVASGLSAYLASHGRDGPRWLTFGQCLRSLGRWDDAEAALRNSLNLCPETARPFVQGQLANLYAKQGRRELAEECFQKAVGSDDAGSCRWLWILRGANLLYLGRYEEAESCQRQAIAINPRPGSPDDCDELAEAWYNLASVLTARQNYKEAVAALAKARSLSPSMPEGHELAVMLAGLPFDTQDID